MVDTPNNRSNWKEWLSRKEAAAFLDEIGCRISPGRLKRLATGDNAGRGPPFTRFRWKTVSYKRTDLEEWAKAEAKQIR